MVVAFTAGRTDERTILPSLLQLPRARDPHTPNPPTTLTELQAVSFSDVITAWVMV